MSIDFTPGEFFDSNLSINMANGNAGTVTRALGMPLDWEYGCGEFDAAELQAACLLFLGMDQAYARPTVQVGNMIFCGIDEDYMNRKVQDLLALANYCVEAGLPVLYG